MAVTRTNDGRVVCFHLTTEPNAYLSNWYPSHFEADGVHYCCAEQYLMRAKAAVFGDDDRVDSIMKTEDPSEMRKLGRAVNGYDGDIWAGMRQVVARRALKAKFEQNAPLRERLIATGDAVLAECARKDRIWGIGLGMDDPARFSVDSWPGRNLLGFTLMLVRDELRELYADAEPKIPLIGTFALRVIRAARIAGEEGIIAAVSPKELWALGLEMDCGKSFREVFGIEIGDCEGFLRESHRIDDPFVLGSAIFSEWRYFTHWADGPMEPEDVMWFEIAASRLAEITDADDY